MRKLILLSFASMLFSCAILWGGQALRFTTKATVAGVAGHITIDEVVGHKVQSNPIPKLKVYLVKADDSRPLVELQQSCRRATTDPNADLLRAYKTCDRNLNDIVALAPTLNAVATAETDRNGQYEFAEVPAADRYRVVAVKPVPGAEPLVIVGLTNKLKPGERVTLDLSGNFPWTRDATP